eukprot:Seg381.26 transcript_id=Seg381.26/GoldUCD/mRNA.D3Y31 product="hypothetical protein" protein_id=Seg381.26/GoldUCD/D3Y31
MTKNFSGFDGEKIDRAQVTRVQVTQDSMEKTEFKSLKIRLITMSPRHRYSKRDYYTKPRPISLTGDMKCDRQNSCYSKYRECVESNDLNSGGSFLSGSSTLVSKAFSLQR